MLARLARALTFTAEARRRLALSEEAVALARRLGDEATLAAVVFDRHMAIWGADPPAPADERLAMATERVTVAERLGDRAMALRARGLRGVDLLEMGDLAGFDADLAAAERAARELRQLHYTWQVPLAHAARAALTGDFPVTVQPAAENGGRPVAVQTSTSRLVSPAGHMGPEIGQACHPLTVRDIQLNSLLAGLMDTANPFRTLS